MTISRNSSSYSSGKSFFPPTVEEVETALPAFIGYTEKAVRRIKDDLLLVPTKINSMRDFENLYGLPFENEIRISVATDELNSFVVTEFKENPLSYILYYSVKLYFENGGGPCYILAVDTYEKTQRIRFKTNPGSRHFGLMEGLNYLTEVNDLSLIVIPEAVKLDEADYSALVQATLRQCHTLGNRFAIFDLYDGGSSNPDLNQNKELFGSEYLHCGSAYYPFVKTTLNSYVGTEGSNVKVVFSGLEAVFGELKKSNIELFRFVKKVLKNNYLTLPSCGAVAGTYVASDRNRGVWKSPANLSLSAVSAPVLCISNQRSELVEVEPEMWKSVNSIRSFSGKGTLVWGARTLAGNESEGQFVPVRRFLIMVKESLVKSTGWVVFEPNDSNTWLSLSRVIENYLTRKWQDGALAGVTPQQAFYVKCGLGTSMTQDDMLNSRIKVEVGLAILSPGEFQVFEFSHLLKKPRIDALRSA